jgi:RNA polymerase sigma factor (sigma-70 family)
MTNELFEQYLVSKRGYAWAIARNYFADESTRQDAVQEASLAAWRSREQFNGSEAAFKAWFGRITVNTCLLILRPRKNGEHRWSSFPTTMGGAIYELTQLIEDTTDTPLPGRAQQAISSLRPEDRDLLLDVYGLEIPRDVLAERMKLNRLALQTRIIKAVQRFRRLYGQDQGQAIPDDPGRDD